MDPPTLVATPTATAASNSAALVAHNRTQSYLSLLSQLTNSVTQETLPSVINTAVQSLSEESASASAIESSPTLGSNVGATSATPGSHVQASALVAADTINAEAFPSSPPTSLFLNEGSATLSSAREATLTTNQSPSGSGYPTFRGMISPAVSSLSQTVLVFTTTLPSLLPALLSSIETLSGTQSPVSTQPTTAAPLRPTSVNAAAEVEMSIIAALTSAGIPPFPAESLGAIILGDSQGSGQANGDTNLDDQQRTAAIEAVMQWLLSFFHE